MSDDLALEVPGELLLGGPESGELLVLQEPLSFWGGVDEENGAIIDAHHPQYGVRLAGKIVLMRGSRGSSSSSSVLLECIRRGTAPRALLLTDPDPLLSAGSAAAQELYGHCCAIVGIDSDVLPGAATWASVAADGTVRFVVNGPRQGDLPGDVVGG